jgi:hypothetical protein
LQEAAVRESELLARAKELKRPTETCRTAVARLKQSARTRNNLLLAMMERTQETVSSRITDPDDPERQNEKVRPLLQERVLDPLTPEEFKGLLEQFEREDYAKLALKQESLRQRIFGAVLSLRGMFHDYVPPKPPAPKPKKKKDEPHLREDYPEPDESPKAVAAWLEKHGAWLDVHLGDPEVRRALIEKLRGMDRFDDRYWRLQSTYLKFLAQGFRPKSREILQEDIKPEQ